MKKTNLFEKWLRNGEEVTGRIVIALEYFWGVKVVFRSDSDFIFAMPDLKYEERDQPWGKTHNIEWKSGEYFLVMNNGGEFGIERINLSRRDIPYTSNKKTLTAETLAWRIFCAMTGQEIDWDYNDMLGAYQKEPLKIQQMY